MLIILKCCPFCDAAPLFTLLEYKDDRRYVEMKLECCIEMKEVLNFSQYRNLNEVDIIDKLKLDLMNRWNTRA